MSITGPRFYTKSQQSIFTRQKSEGMRPTLKIDCEFGHNKPVFEPHDCLWPNTCITLIESCFGERTGRRLGCFVSSNTILTNANVVYDRGHNQKAKNVVLRCVFTGRAVSNSQCIQIPERYIDGNEQQSARWNFALIKTSEEFDKLNGYLGIRVMNPQVQTQLFAFACNREGYASLLPVTQQFPENTIIGSPILKKINLSYRLVGIICDEKKPIFFQQAFQRWASPFLQIKCESLYLSNTKQGDLLAANIIEKKLTNLSTLRLQSNQITDKGVQALCQQPFHYLNKLYLSQNKITTEGFKYIIRAEFFCLNVLHLNENQIDNEGMRLIRYSNWPNLKFLYLRENKMDNPSIELLLQCHWPEMAVLDIDLSRVSSNPLIKVLKYKMPQFQNVDIRKLCLKQMKETQNQTGN